MFVLISVFGEDIKIVSTCKKIRFMLDTMKEKAIEYICDRIGKKNYVDTLNLEKSMSDIDCEYILKYYNGNRDRIDVYHKEKIVNSGFLYNSTYNDIIKEGFFCIRSIDVNTEEIGVTETVLVIPKKKKVNDKVKSVSFDDVLNELKLKLESRNTSN